MREEYMSHWYFFKKDGMCTLISGLMRNKVHDTYLREPVMYEGRPVKFHLILHWLHRSYHGANLGFLDEQRLNYVATLDDLPPGGGAFSAGYDVDLEDLRKIRERNIPFVDKSCPRVKRLRKQLLSGNPATHQFIFMIPEHHLLRECYRSAFPADIILVEPETYERMIRDRKNEKPVHLLVYGVFRPKEVKALIDFIESEYPHPDNILDGYLETRCCWTRQGLLEEIESVVPGERLNEVWVICSNERDTSTRGIIKEIEEKNARAVVVKNEGDIPATIAGDARIGVLLAPIPMPQQGRNLIRLIRERYGCGGETVAGLAAAG
jgi:4-hydroxy-3-methylbut-2-enyl diphosphate reductase IspH